MQVTPFVKSSRSRQKFPAQISVATLNNETVRVLIQITIDGAPARCKLDLTISEAIALQHALETITQNTAEQKIRSFRSGLQKQLTPSDIRDIP